MSEKTILSLFTINDLFAYITAESSYTFYILKVK